MDSVLFDEKIHLDTESEMYLRYVDSDTESKGGSAHHHNFYELFLVLKGEVCHVVNDGEWVLGPGSLVFIRDFDQHTFQTGPQGHYEFLNLAFSRETFRSMGQFLGEGFPAETLLSAQNPPTVVLTANDTEGMAHALLELNQFADKAFLRFKVRALLVHVFGNFFYNYTERLSQIPFWLSYAYDKMRFPQNFTAGAQRMYELSGKSREHLTRCMKQHYRTTPTAYVNELRLKYAANLLLISDLNVTDICYECGFENLAWFYKSFFRKYEMTPKEYRQRYRNDRGFSDAEG